MESFSFVYVVKQLELALRPRIEHAAAEGGMTAAQYTALTVLHRRPGITSSELARRSFVRPQTMAGTLDPLLEAGLIRRERDPEHGRRMRIFLTDEGEAAMERTAPPIEALEELLVGDLSASERAQFAEYLRRARNTIDAAGHRAPSA
ncbi:MarR family winged helix-turn-helix transcriptional regulator [Microbacterium marinilacus]|uniref:HTH marR-type domain-containing protein n=1 Tax=Microbacterium marinilacus TaxID=415209 RepID=A0ABP7BT15_9MICO|nr:MarR family transcriptional regulator [Microbacterium marinilacus]MBY0689055.1 MarR family transcriptional regulator [Microbacterium marinilacus]